jgi:hypothetical protein
MMAVDGDEDLDHEVDDDDNDIDRVDNISESEKIVIDSFNKCLSEDEYNCIKLFITRGLDTVDLKENFCSTITDVISRIKDEVFEKAQTKRDDWLQQKISFSAFESMFKWLFVETHCISSLRKLILFNVFNKNYTWKEQFDLFETRIKILGRSPTSPPILSAAEYKELDGQPMKRWKDDNYVSMNLPTECVSYD